MPIVITGRRKYFIFPYNDELRLGLKELGAKWDPVEKGWWTSTTNKHVEQMTALYEELAGWTEDPEVLDEFDKDYQTNEALKSLGAVWDATRFRWTCAKDHKNLDQMRDLVRQANQEHEDKSEQQRAQEVELSRRREIGPVHWGGTFPNEIVAWMKENKGMFVDGYWYMPTLELREEAATRLWDWDKAKQQKKDAKWTDCVKFTQWSQWKNGCSYTVGQIVTVRDKDNLPPLVTGDTAEVVRVASSFTRDGMSFGAPAGMDDAWSHTVYLRKTS